MSNHKNTILIDKIQKEYDAHKKLDIKMNKWAVARKLGVTRQAVNYHMRKNVNK